MSRIEKIGDATLILGDCMDVLPTLGKVDAIVTDPPYFRVKGDYWDNEWDNDAGFLSWMRELVSMLSERLQTNGSLYLFASPQMAGRVECVIRERLSVLAHAVWRKGRGNLRATTRGNAAGKEALRTYFAATERIIFAEHYGTDDVAMEAAGYRSKCDEAARDTFGKYITGVRQRHGLSMKELTAAVGAHGAVNHGGACSNWEAGNNVPTLEHYKKLQEVFPGCFDRGYAELRDQYEDLRAQHSHLREQYEASRRPFFLSDLDQWSDVWDFDPVAAYPGKHPCEKPVPLLAHMLNISTRPGDLVLDAFMGSGSTGSTALILGRRFIGIERDEAHFEAACKRIEQAAAQHSLFDIEPANQPEQLGLEAA